MLRCRLCFVVLVQKGCVPLGSRTVCSTISQKTLSVLGLHDEVKLNGSYFWSRQACFLSLEWISQQCETERHSTIEKRPTMMVCVLFVALNGRTEIAMEFNWKRVKEDAVLRKNFVKRCPLFAMLGVFAVLSCYVAWSLRAVRHHTRHDRPKGRSPARSLRMKFQRFGRTAYVQARKGTKSSSAQWMI